MGLLGKKLTGYEIFGGKVNGILDIFDIGILEHMKIGKEIL